MPVEITYTKQLSDAKTSEHFEKVLSEVILGKVSTGLVNFANVAIMPILTTA